MIKQQDDDMESNLTESIVDQPHVTFTSESPSCKGMDGESDGDHYNDSGSMDGESDGDHYNDSGSMDGESDGDHYNDSGSEQNENNEVSWSLKAFTYELIHINMSFYNKEIIYRNRNF